VGPLPPAVSAVMCAMHFRTRASRSGGATGRAKHAVPLGGNLPIIPQEPRMPATAGAFSTP
jgi:hypothetical protein